jgi:hypothetical protein
MVFVLGRFLDSIWRWLLWRILGVGFYQGSLVSGFIKGPWCRVLSRVLVVVSLLPGFMNGPWCRVLSWVCVVVSLVSGFMKGPWCRVLWRVLVVRFYQGSLLSGFIKGPCCRVLVVVSLLPGPWCRVCVAGYYEGSLVPGFIKWVSSALVSSVIVSPWIIYRTYNPY